MNSFKCRACDGTGEGPGWEIPCPGCNGSGWVKKKPTNLWLNVGLIVSFAATIAAANWMIGNVGTCIPNGPCIIPVGFGLEAPSGVLMIGLLLVVRDLIHSKSGELWAWLAILLGAGLSALFAAPALVVASVVAFALGEGADLLVYRSLWRRQLYLAVVASGIVGAIIDSAIFLWLAFGSIDFIAGQIIGKLWMTLLALPIIWLFNRKRAQ